jgi:serine/threonine protein kinase
MQNLERHMVETGRVIHRRYLLQRLIKQGQFCAVYQGFDQILQRAVAVKVPQAEHIPAYRAVIRATSQFTHPNIIGIYDLIVEPDCLYIVQEYVEGDDFTTLLQAQLTPYEVSDFGIQICRALLYAGSPARKVCHGDLTPAAIIRDSRGGVRVNNFALPSDLYYFTSWNVIGGDNTAISDPDLPCGQMSEGRRADDTRAVGLLLYQLVAGRPPGATSVDPPTDRRLRFMRNIPAQLCEVIARAIVRQHPQYIGTPETLHAELKALVDALEPPPPVISSSSPNLAYQAGDIPSVTQFSPAGTGQLAAPLPMRETAQTGTGFAAYRPDTSTQIAPPPMEPPLVTDMSVKLATARQAAYGAQSNVQQPRRINLPVLLGIGFALFALFFVIGYFLAHAIFPG